MAAGQKGRPEFFLTSHCPSPESTRDQGGAEVIY